MTMGTTWAFNPVENRWKSPESLLQSLVEITSRGGNLLLNVGPTPEGTFPPEAVERLAFISRWMALNSPAIHNTTYAPPVTWPGGRVTRAGSRFYLHVFERPAEGKLAIGDFPGQASGAALMNGEALEFRQDGSRLEINLPVNTEPGVTVICVETEAA